MHGVDTFDPASIQSSVHGFIAETGRGWGSAWNNLFSDVEGSREGGVRGSSVVPQNNCK